MASCTRDDVKITTAFPRLSDGRKGSTQFSRLPWTVVLGQFMSGNLLTDMTGFVLSPPTRRPALHTNVKNKAATSTLHQKKEKETENFVDYGLGDFMNIDSNSPPLYLHEK